MVSNKKSRDEVPLRPDFRHLIIGDKRWDREQKHKIGILYVESGEKSEPLSWEELLNLSNKCLDTPNGASFLKKNKKYSICKIPGEQSWWLPIEYAEKEVEKARANKGNYQYFHDEFKSNMFLATKEDRGVDYFFNELEKLVSPNPEIGAGYFYGIEAESADINSRKMHYLKAGKAINREKVIERMTFRNKRDKSLDLKNIRIRGRWALRLKAGIEGDVVERLFNDSFGTHAVLRKNGKRDRKEFFKFDDVIAEAVKRIVETYPEHRHPYPTWQEI